MSSPISSPTMNRAGLCPHGLPPAACPICSGGAGGGGGKIRENVATKPMKSGEWSYMKCYAAGMAMQAQENRVENAKLAFDRQIEFAKQLGKTIDNIANRIHTAIQNLQNSLPPILRAPLALITNVIINPILNLMAQIPKIIEKFANFQQNVREFVQQVAEKLVTVLGEIKNFVDKKLGDKIKKKIKSFFSFLIPEEETEDNYKNDETLSIFKSREIKKHLLKIFTIKKKRDDNDYRRVKD